MTIYSVPGIGLVGQRILPIRNICWFSYLWTHPTNEVVAYHPNTTEWLAKWCGMKASASLASRVCFLWLGPIIVAHSQEQFDISAPYGSARIQRPLESLPGHLAFPTFTHVDGTRHPAHSCSLSQAEENQGPSGMPGQQEASLRPQSFAA